MTDQQATSPADAMDPALRTRNRAILVGIMVLAMLPLFAAVFIYYGTPGSVSGAQTNRGALLNPPERLEALGLRDAGGIIRAEGPRLWRLVYIQPEPCGEACLEQLHQLRQLHTLLGRDADRAIRIAALAVEPVPAVQDVLDEAFPKLEQARIESTRLQTVLETRALVGGDALDPATVAAGGPFPAAGVLVVDPLGNVIFFHGLDQIGEALLFDLKRLLRLSNIG